MKVGLTIEKDVHERIERELKNYDLKFNTFINRLIESSEDLVPAYSEIDKDKRKNKTVNVLINKRNKRKWNNIINEQKDRHQSEILRGYIVSYLSKPLNIRELIIFNSTVRDIKNAIFNKSSLKIKYLKDAKGEYRIVEPYRIKTTPKEEYNYLVAYCKKKKDFRSFRISRILEVKASKSELEQKNNGILKRVDKYFDAFLSYGEYVKIKFNDDGLKSLKKITLNRPLEVDKKTMYKNKEINKILKLDETELKDNHIKVFECTEAQAEVYFFQFLEKVLIMSPKSLRDTMELRLKKAIGLIDQLDN
ncbi:hypothetical protein UF10_05530 [Peptostreptococcus russellii]|uniref:WYL domain-containing protein n=1 Tax=Peptostreptococcus russellii TaxID=215200 RepID=A0A2P7Q0C0_9FIRM|nr:WYL domain-containing protein [Peptostreptococcus russellii]PSJ31387.1 hypothetical protein UF10_05530 [Peptostreptococcus russellii]